MKSMKSQIKLSFTLFTPHLMPYVTETCLKKTEENSEVEGTEKAEIRTGEFLAAG